MTANNAESKKFSNLTPSEFASVGESFSLLHESERFDYLTTAISESRLSTDHIIELARTDISPRVRYLAYRWGLLECLNEGNNFNLEKRKKGVQTDCKIKGLIESDSSITIRALLSAYGFISGKDESFSYAQFTSLSEEAKIEVFGFAVNFTRKRQERFEDIVISILNDYTEDPSSLNERQIDKLVKHITESLRQAEEDYWNRYDGFLRYNSAEKLDKFWLVVPKLKSGWLQVELAKALPIPYLYNIPGINVFKRYLLEPILYRSDFRDEKFRESILFSDADVGLRAAAASGLPCYENVLIRILDINDPNIRSKLLEALASQRKGLPRSIPSSYILCELLSSDDVCGERSWEMRGFYKHRLLVELNEELRSYSYTDQKIIEYELRLIQFCRFTSQLKSKEDLENLVEENLRSLVVLGSFWKTLRNLRSSTKWILLPQDRYWDPVLEEHGYYQKLQEEESAKNNIESLAKIENGLHDLKEEFEKLHEMVGEIESMVNRTNEEVLDLRSDDKNSKKLSILVSESYGINSRLRDIERAVISLLRHFPFLWLIISALFLYFAYDHFR